MDSRRKLFFLPAIGGSAKRPITQFSAGFVLANWAALVALWALPYLTLLEHLRLDAARTEILQWSLVVIGVLGIGSLLYTAWKDTRDPAWRARHGLPARDHAGRQAER